MNSIFRVTGGAQVDDRWFPKNYFLVSILLVGFLIGVDLFDAPIHNGDIDDILRALQVQALLQDGGWLNPTIPGIHMPEPYISPWSRLVDLPYALIALTLQSTLGQDGALTVAFFVWPAIMAVLFCIGFVGVLGRIAPGRGEPSPAISVIIFFMPYAVWEFTPGGHTSD
ncbi:hypothetical protein AC244_14125 [Ensifer adhaerens]|uniref:Glycosyltransferase RgtA/B/C/D-like domain-containing protein n=1 Tax=Ensifer adhaerens TaxID=106592 RepID=A0A0L8BVG2_ENSAD|nr:hypothetical protein [Ensifer adhaerens]KOF18494.1 hypothetical protein AC244_14125 [Ensifer adhaerens]